MIDTGTGTMVDGRWPLSRGGGGAGASDAQHLPGSRDHPQVLLADARPEIAGELPDISRYDTILLASPNWNVRAPMIMTTFTEQLDFTGKTVHPLTTSAMSGLGTTERDYAASCPGAVFKEGSRSAAKGGQRRGPWHRRLAEPRRLRLDTGNGMGRLHEAVPPQMSPRCR